MEQINIRKEYDAFVLSGDLKELFPGLSGEWKKDRNRFVKLHEQMYSSVKDLNVNFKLVGTDDIE